MVEEVVVFWNGDDFELRLSVVDSIIFVNWFVGEVYCVESVKFSDGQIWDFLIFSGLDNNDVVIVFVVSIVGDVEQYVMLEVVYLIYFDVIYWWQVFVDGIYWDDIVGGNVKWFKFDV